METTGQAGGRVELRAVESGKKPSRRPRGLSVARRFTKPGEDPFAAVEWELRSAKINNETRRGGVRADRRRGAEELVAARHERRRLEVLPRSRRHARARAQREAADRPRGRHASASGATTAATSATPEDAQAFSRRAHPRARARRGMAFNSPVWFNLGVEGHAAAGERLLHQLRRGHHGVDHGPREDRGDALQGRLGHRLEPLAHPLLDASSSPAAARPRVPSRSCAASTPSRASIKSGGKTRRAAKMVILNVDHPDILEFIRCKAEEEKKAWALIEAGYDGGFNVPGGAYDSVFYQNANHSVRVTDAFMQSALANGGAGRRAAVTTGEVVDTLPGARRAARDRRGARTCCGDPGHPVRHHDQPLEPGQGLGAHQLEQSRAREYMFLDDTACNLASLNLMRFVDDGRRASTSRRSGTRSTLTILAQEIIVDHADYPTPADRAQQPPVPPARARLREPRRAADGVGPALRQRRRAATCAAAITSLMCGQAYRRAPRSPRRWARSPRYRQNREPFLAGDRACTRRRRTRCRRPACRADLHAAARATWAQALERRPAPRLQERARSRCSRRPARSPS